MGMKLHNGKKYTKITAPIAVLFMSILMIFGTVFGAAGLNSGSQNAAEAKVDSGTPINLDDGKGGFDNDGLKSLMKVIGNKAGATTDYTNSYKKLDEKFASGKTLNAGQMLTTVIMGGYKWNVAYVSRAAYGEKDTTHVTTTNNTYGKGTNAVGEAGDIVVTLWLADTTVATSGIATDGYTYSYGGWSYLLTALTDSNSKYYPTNLYSSSYVRSRLNGTKYVRYKDDNGTDIPAGVGTQIKSGSNKATVQTTGDQVGAWATLIEKYGDYISTPAQMSWQYSQGEKSGHKWSDWGGDAPNSGLDGSGNSWYGNAYQTSDNMSKFTTAGNSNNDTNYGAWGNDKLWLPSHFETGYDESGHVGLWKTTANQRSHSSSYTWSRSGYYSSADLAYLLSSTGGINSDRVYYRYAVRPALHLNLKSAANAASGAVAPTPTDEAKGSPEGDNDGLTYNRTAQNAVNFDAEKSYVKKVEYTDGFGNETVAEYNTPASGASGAPTLKSVNYTPNGGTSQAITVNRESYTTAWSIDYTNGIVKATNAGTFTVTAGLRTPAWDGVTYLDGNGAVQTLNEGQMPTDAEWKPWEGTASAGSVPNFWETQNAAGTVKWEGKNVEKSVTFIINQVEITADNVSGILDTYTYTGSAINPAPTVKVTLGSTETTLTKGDDKDYTVTYAGEQTHAGDSGVTVTITGVGNYKGTVTKTFKIKKATPVVSGVQRTTTGTLYDGAEPPELTCTAQFTPAGETTAVTVEGAIKIDAEKLQKGQNQSYTWTFTPTNTTDFEVVKGSITLTVEEATVKELTITFDYAQYFADLKSGTAQKIYASIDIKNDLKDIIKNYITLSGTMTDGTNLPDNLKDSFTLSRTNNKMPATLGGLNVWNSDPVSEDWKAVADGSALITLQCGNKIITDKLYVPVTYVKLASIAVTQNPTKTAYEALTAFDPAGMVVTATYNDGNTAAVTGYTISYSDPDHEALWYGDSHVDISYSEEWGGTTKTKETAKTTATVSVSKIVIDTSKLTFEDASKPYNGEAQTIAVTGGPEGAFDVKYSYEYKGTSIPANSVVNVKEDGYTVIATLEAIDDSTKIGCNYSLSGELQFTATLTIEKVAYDGVDNIKFEKGEAQYSASSKAGSLEVQNVPEGVTVTYKYAKKSAPDTEIQESEVVERGVYIVTAEFEVDGNHKGIAALSAELEIIAHTLTDSEVGGVETSYTYNGASHKPEPVVKVTLNNTETTLTKGDDYTVAYSTEDYAAGTEVTVTVTGVGNFTGTVTKKFTIAKAELELTWAYEGTGVYDGNPHNATLKVTGTVFDADKTAVTTETLATNVTVYYTTENGGNSARTAAGDYKPNYSNYPTTSPWSNYEPKITNSDFKFTVKKATLPTIEFTDKTVTYDGDSHSIYVTVDGTETTDATICNGEVAIAYYTDESANAFTGATNAGTTHVRVEITCSNGNYEIPANVAKMYANLKIEAKEIAADDVTGVEATYTYNGSEIAPDLKVAVALKEGAEAVTLVDTQDYTVTYTGDRVNATAEGSQVTLTVTGAGNYKGTVEKTFTIDKARLGYEWVGKDDEYVYNGAAQGVTANFTGVAEKDKTTIVPVIYYSGDTGTTYDKTTDKPTNAGRYKVEIVLEAAHDNYYDFTSEQAQFTIEKATPKVTVKYVSWNGTDKVYVGQLLPEITVATTGLNETVTSVAGGVSWALVDGAQPVLKLNLNSYQWVFTPEGDDANNFTEATGELEITAVMPTFKSFTVEWNTDDKQQPFLWSSTKLDKVREYLWVNATLDDGTEFGRVTKDYSISGTWGGAASPKEAGHDLTKTWDLTITLTGAEDVTLQNVQYNQVTLKSIEVKAADESNGIKKDYDALSKFDTSSIIVNAIYGDDTVKENVTGYTVTYQQTDERLWYGNNYVTINYNDGTVENPVSYIIDGLKVKKIEFNTSSIVFDAATVSVDYNGTAQSLTLNNAEAFTIGTISYVYKIKNGVNWDTIDGVTEVTNAGEYLIEATLTIVDDESIGEGVYTKNYTLDNSFRSVYFTINKINYKDADKISIPASVSADYNGGDTAALYTADIKKASTGVSDEVWAIASFEYRDSVGGTVLTAEQAVNAGSYVVTISFDTDDNHNAIESKTVQLTVNKIDPTINPALQNGPALKNTSVKEYSLANSGENDTEGYYEWVSNGSFDPETYVLHNGANQVFYKFVPNDTINYNTLENKAYTITAKENYAISMYASVNQGVTELFTSYTLDKLLELANKEDGHLTISVYLVLNDGTEKEVKEGYTVALKTANEGNYLTAGKCYLVFTYKNEEEGLEFKDEKNYVTVSDVALGRIEAMFDQETEAIYTSGNIDTILGLIESGKVTLTVESYYNNGDYRRALTAEEYTLSGDWSKLTADGKYSVTVTANEDTSVTAKFEIDVTLVLLTEITVDDSYNQNGKKIHASDDISALEKLISDGEVSLVITAHYNDGSEKPVDFGTDGYTVTIDTEKFVVGTNTVTVHYTDKETTFEVDVTAVLVVGLYTKVNDVNKKIYTDTPLTDIEKLLTVTAYYNDGTEGEVKDFKVKLPEGADKLTAGTQVGVNVDYTGSDKAEDFKTFELIIGVIKHETVLVFNGQTEYDYDGTVHTIDSGAEINHSQTSDISYEIGGSIAAVLAAGDYTLDITVPETDDYYGATAEVNITVNKARYNMDSVKFDDSSVTYDGKAHYVVISGSLPLGVAVNEYLFMDGSSNTVKDPTNAGSYSAVVKFSQTDTTNYELVADMSATLTIEKAEVEIDESGLLAKTYTYTGVEQTVEGATIVNADDGAAIAYNNNTFTGIPAGGVLAVEITVAEGDNYKAFSKVVKVPVSKAKLTLTANDNEITYGEAPADDGVTAAGFVNGETVDSLSGKLNYTYDYSQYGNVGKYVISIGGVSSDNYEITLKGGTLTVNKAEADVDWTVGRYVYDGVAHSPVATFTDLFGVKVNLTVTISGKNGGIISEAIAAGDYVATASTHNPNYVLKDGTTTKEFSIIADTDNWVKFDFRKDYKTVYGSVPETAEELAALAELLINQSYVRVFYNGDIADIDTIIKLMTVRLEVNSGTPVTSVTPVGKYNICFEFKPEYAAEYASYTVYQTLEDSENTNLGRFIIEQRQLSLNWGNTEFKYDGTAHLLTATVNGFVDEKIPVSFTMTETGGEFGFDIDGTTVKFKLAVNGDFKSVGGHVVTVTIDNGNYVITNPYATVSISAAEGGISSLDWIIIAVAAVCAVGFVAAVVVAAKRKGGGSRRGGYDGDGFNDVYDGE